MRIFGIVGWKNAGKTGLMERLIAEITKRGFLVSTVKHAHHRFDVDQPGKDSYRHRVAGAEQVLLSSVNRWALMSELRNIDEPPLAELLGQLAPVDLVLVEGYKRDKHAKIEAYRVETRNELIASGDDTIVALARNLAFPKVDLPQFDLDDTQAIATFILQYVGLESSAQSTPVTPTAKPSTVPLRNDCFALPQGVDWTPVDVALAHLETRLTPVVAREICAVSKSEGRILADDQIARRANPPAANSAVDGYGFTHAALTGTGGEALPLAEGRAAAGAPFRGKLPFGQAVRILTGAMLPLGVDTVVLEEDVRLSEAQICFASGLKAGANARRAGEDLQAGDLALPAGHLMRAPDVALLSATGLAEVPVFQPLRVAVLSTGDEIADPGSTKDPAITYDANRPMLLALARRWGYAPVDLGKVADDRDALRQCLDQAADQADVILTSGGASAGEEDHVSALLNEAGAMRIWRIAMKPGRPLALGLWRGVPVFALPGNPVAALVCTLIFARPALSKLAGGTWLSPQGFMVPAGFEKQKKAGRREYLRARMGTNGQVEVFKSEGSGRISGLSWAEGLVELDDGARQVRPGDLVRFLPYGAFGL